MTDLLPTNNLDSADSAILTSRAEHNLFRSAALVFGFVRVCIYLILANGISFALQWTARFLPGSAPHHPFAPKNLIITETVALAGALLGGLAMSRLEKRPLGAYGLPLRSAFGKAFWQGVGFGLAEISIVIGAIATFGSYRFGTLAIYGGELVRWGLFWGVFFLVVGVYEEFAFRGYVQFTLGQGMGFWPAAILLSLAFGGVHLSNPGETWAGIAGVVATGIFWCFTLRRTGTLWFAVGMHASFDFGETFLYSVPDSGAVFPGHLSNATLAGATWVTGGSAGPEASVFDFLVLAVFFYVIHYLYPRRPAGDPTT